MASTHELGIKYAPHLTLVGRGDWTATDPLVALSELRTLERSLEKATRDAVAQARTQGCTWTQIGEALQISRQSAWERFTPSDL